MEQKTKPTRWEWTKTWRQSGGGAKGQVQKKGRFKSRDDCSMGSDVWRLRLWRTEAVKMIRI